MEDEYMSEGLNGGRRGKRRKKKRSLVGRFLKIVTSIVLVFVMVSASALFAYSKLGGGFTKEGGTPISGNKLNILQAFVKQDISLNVVLFGVDEDETRTDVIIVAHFDSKSGNVSMMSVPRDTRVTIPDEMHIYLQQKGKYIPYNGVCKINEVHAYAGKEKANEFSMLALEELLGIEIHHYAKVNFAGFVELVDLVDGVDFYVPQDMKWDMRDTGDILIDLKEGMQHLDGEKAQMLVRFRRYAQGDVQRVQVQQDFVKAVVQKLLSTDNLIAKAPDLIKTGYEYVETDVTLTDALKYANYIERVNMDSLTTQTLPGAGKYVGQVSYFIHDPVETKVAVSQVFFSDNVTADTISSKDKVIEVANGGSKGGFAGENQQMLEKQGYNVPEVSTYEGTKTDHTRIYVVEKGIGEDLKSFYPGSEIIMDKTALREGVDILIVLGEKE